MLPFIFTNVTQILRCRPDAHRGRIYNVSFFFFFQRWRFIRSQWHSGEKSPSRLCILPSSPPSLPSLLPSPLSLLCTGVWSCFLMSSGTSGAITLSPSVVTLCTCCKALSIQPHVCIHSCTPAPEFPKWTKPPHSYRIKDRVKVVFRLTELDVCYHHDVQFFFFFWVYKAAINSREPQMSDVGSSVSLWVTSNARFLWTLTGMLNVCESVCASAPQSAGSSWWVHMPV